MKKKFTSFLALVLSDTIVVFLSFWLAYFFRKEIFPLLFAQFKNLFLHPFSNFFDHFYMVVVWILIFAYEKLYTKRFPFWEEVRILIKSATISSAMIMIMIFITRKQLQYSRPIVILAWLLSLLLFPLSRYLTKTLLVKANLWKKKLIILGVHQTTLLILKSLERNKTMGYEVLGFLDNDPQKIGKIFQGVKVIGSFSDLEDVTKTYKSKDIMITTPHLPRKELKELLTRCENVSDSMWLIPRSGDFITEGVDIEVLGEVLTLSIKKNLAKPWNIFIKSLYEKVLTLILIIFLSPIFLLIALTIKIGSKGPAIFIQKRLGQGKKMFNLLKFRSMYVNSDHKLDEYFQTNPDAKRDWDNFKKIKGYDPRVTKSGKLLRKYSLDELPQLFNVLQGKMSLVGPRPYLLSELEGKDSFQRMIAKVKPGITGLWQVSGRNELPFRERILLDEYYIRNWSLWLDLVILMKSVKVFFSRKGAY